MTNTIRLFFTSCIILTSAAFAAPLQCQVKPLQPAYLFRDIYAATNDTQKQSQLFIKNTGIPGQYDTNYSQVSLTNSNGINILQSVPSPDQRFVFVLYQGSTSGSGTLDIYRTGLLHTYYKDQSQVGAKSLVGQVRIDANPRSVLPASDGKSVYIAYPDKVVRYPIITHGSSQYPVSLDFAHAMTYNVSVSAPATAAQVMAVSADGLHLFVLNQQGNRISVINPKTGAVREVSTVSGGVGQQPIAIFVPRQQPQAMKYAYVLTNKGQQIVTIGFSNTQAAHILQAKAGKQGIMTNTDSTFISTPVLKVTGHTAVHITPGSGKTVKKVANKKGKQAQKDLDNPILLTGDSTGSTLAVFEAGNILRGNLPQVITFTTNGNGLPVQNSAPPLMFTPAQIPASIAFGPFGQYFYIGGQGFPKTRQNGINIYKVADNKSLSLQQSICLGGKTCNDTSLIQAFNINLNPMIQAPTSCFNQAVPNYAGGLSLNSHGMLYVSNKGKLQLTKAPVVGSLVDSNDSKGIDVNVQSPANVAVKQIQPSNFLSVQAQHGASNFTSQNFNVHSLQASNSVTFSSKPSVVVTKSLQFKVNGKTRVYQLKKGNIVYRDNNGAETTLKLPFYGPSGANLAKKVTNSGITSLAYSGDGNSFYAAQSAPYTHSAANNHLNIKYPGNTIFQINASNGEVMSKIHVGESFINWMDNGGYNIKNWGYPIINPDKYSPMSLQNWTKDYAQALIGLDTSGWQDTSITKKCEDDSCEDGGKRDAVNELKDHIKNNGQLILNQLKRKNDKVVLIPGGSMIKQTINISQINQNGEGLNYIIYGKAYNPGSLDIKGENISYDCNSKSGLCHHKYKAKLEQQDDHNNAITFWVRAGNTCGKPTDCNSNNVLCPVPPTSFHRSYSFSSEGDNSIEFNAIDVIKSNFKQVSVCFATGQFPAYLINFSVKSSFPEGNGVLKSIANDKLNNSYPSGIAVGPARKSLFVKLKDTLVQVALHPKAAQWSTHGAMTTSGGPTVVKRIPLSPAMSSYLGQVADSDSFVPFNLLADSSQNKILATTSWFNQDLVSGSGLSNQQVVNFPTNKFSMDPREPATIIDNPYSPTAYVFSKEAVNGSPSMLLPLQERFVFNTSVRNKSGMLPITITPLVQNIIAQAAGINAAAITPDGQYLMTGAQLFSGVSFIDTESQQKDGSLSFSDTNNFAANKADVIAAVGPSPDGREIYTAADSGDNSLHVYRAYLTPNGYQMAKTYYNIPVNSCGGHASGTPKAIMAYDSRGWFTFLAVKGSCTVYKFFDGALMPDTITTPGPIENMEVAPDGSHALFLNINQGGKRVLLTVPGTSADSNGIALHNWQANDGSKSWSINGKFGTLLPGHTITNTMTHLLPNTPYYWSFEGESDGSNNICQYQINGNGWKPCFNTGPRGQAMVHIPASAVSNGSLTLSIRNVAAANGNTTLSVTDDMQLWPQTAATQTVKAKQ